MKTSTSKVFFNLFNTGQRDMISATFKDTVTALEMKACEYKDCVLLVDDYHPSVSSNEKQRMNENASQLLRIYGDGITKSRSTKNLNKQKEFPPRGLAVITGEGYLEGESTVARYIGIEVEKSDFDTKILSYYQKNPLIVSTHFTYFINWIAQNFERLVKDIEQRFSEYRFKYIDLFRHKRFSEATAILQIVTEIILEYCYYNSLYTREQVDYTKKIWIETIINVIKTHENKNIKQKPEIMYLIAIQELLESNRMKLLTLNDNSIKENYGYEDEDKLYLFPNLTFSEVQKYWNKQGIEFQISPEQINKELDNIGAIESKFEGKVKRRTLKIKGKGDKRFLVIYKNKIDEILNCID